MGMYQSYLEGHTEEESKQIVAEAIKEQLRLFMVDDQTFGESVKDVINTKLSELNKQLGEADNYDAQMFLSEKIDTLTGALEILEGK